MDHHLAAADVPMTCLLTVLARCSEHLVAEKEPIESIKERTKVILQVGYSF